MHRTGVMRLATAADEIYPLKDPRVRSWPAYLIILLLERVVTKLGSLPEVHAGVIEGLFSEDLAYLQDLYNRHQRPRPRRTLAVTCPHCGAEHTWRCRRWGDNVATPWTGYQEVAFLGRHVHWTLDGAAGARPRAATAMGRRGRRATERRLINRTHSPATSPRDRTQARGGGRRDRRRSRRPLGRRLRCPRPRPHADVGAAGPPGSLRSRWRCAAPSEVADVLGERFERTEAPPRLTAQLPGPRRPGAVPRRAAIPGRGPRAEGAGPAGQPPEPRRADLRAAPRRVRARLRARSAGPPTYRVHDGPARGRPGPAPPTRTR